jgi:hypothetical protein
MRRRQNKWLLLQIFGALFALTLGFVLFCLLVDFPADVAFGFGGIVLCIIGIGLFWEAMRDDGPPVELDGSEIGCIQLNGFDLVAYERETQDGKKQFRLASSCRLSPEREAALIRYLSAEGFLVSLWPGMKERIQEEAGWAFLV